MLTRTFATSGGPVDLGGTLFPLRRGTGDPTTAIEGGEAWRTLRTPEGAATLHLAARGTSIDVAAWGSGAAWAVESAPALVGADDTAEGFVAHDPVVASLRRRHRGLRLTRTGTVLPLLIAAVLEQKVTGAEARRAWRGLVGATAEPAPGPRSDLRLPPDPARVAALPSFAFHRLGVERRRAEVIRALCARPARIESLVDLEPSEARARLLAHRGIGPWTAAEVGRLALGDPDAVSVGDYHLPHLVAWLLAGEPRGTDERMLELLEPYRGQRGRVQRLLEASGAHAPRFGPRMEIRSIARL